VSNDFYLNNPLIHRDRRLGRRPSSWVNQFSCDHLRPLIICRGPIRKEAMDVFEEMGIDQYGILLSEKDSIVYRNALAPELRLLTDPNRVHRVPDYSGANKEERNARIRQIISIAKDNGYNSIFAGYGFMAEDETMVAAMEKAGLTFIGPCSRTVHDAGMKDEAKRTALQVGVSVTPGIDNGTALTLLKKYPDAAALEQLCKDEALPITAEELSAGSTLENKADLVLAASYAAGKDLYTVDELCATLTEAVEKMSQDYPRNRVRLKAISGGGGKGQRILGVGDAKKTPEMVREILNEVKTTGVGDNKNVLVELNIETTRHQEIQVIGNGDWTKCQSHWSHCSGL
jgi:biotin carboxylase